MRLARVTCVPAVIARATAGYRRCFARDKEEPILTLTDQASHVIRALAEKTDDPEQAGLRIAAPGNGSEALTVKSAVTPEAGDEIVEDNGARVFLEPAAATLLGDQMLDARVDDDGRVEFMLASS